MADILVTPEKLIQFYAHLLNEEKSAATAEKYLRDARAFLAFLRDDSVTREAVIAFKNRLAEQYAPRTVNAMLASLNCLLEFLHLPEYRVKNLRTQRQTYRAESRELTNAEYTRLLHAAKKNPKLRLILRTFGATGIRVSELQHFTVESVRRGTVRIQCKGKIREILLTRRLQDELLAYAKKKQIHSGAIFLSANGKPMHRGSIWGQMKRLCRAAGVEQSKVFPHNVRKLFARNFYGVEKDIAALADILGHSSIETTRIYIMTTGREHREKLAAVERLFCHKKSTATESAFCHGTGIKTLRTTFIIQQKKKRINT